MKVKVQQLEEQEENKNKICAQCSTPMSLNIMNYRLHRRPKPKKWINKTTPAFDQPTFFPGPIQPKKEAKQSIVQHPSSSLYEKMTYHLTAEKPAIAKPTQLTPRSHRSQHTLMYLLNGGISNQGSSAMLESSHASINTDRLAVERVVGFAPWW